MKIKGFDENLQCRGYQFEIGKTYDTGAPEDKLELCSNTVFHYCNSLQQVHIHYSCINNNRFCEIEVLGKEITDGEKCGSNKIKILREITGEELLQLKGMINENTGLFNTGKCNTGNCNTGNRNTGGWNTGNCNTGKYNTGGWNTGHCNTGDCNTGGWNIGNCNTGDWNTGNWNSGGCNTGNWNSCNYSNGVFCNTDDRNIRIFNKPSGMSLRDFYNSKYYDALVSEPLILTEWVYYSKSEMDTQEKKALGGYLKQYDYKEACKIWWDKLTEENKKIIMEIPNFDTEVFFDITGIDLR